MNNFSNEPNPYEREPTSFTGIDDYRMYLEKTRSDKAESQNQTRDPSEAESREEIFEITCLR